jgi:hypothetical protein
MARNSPTRTKRETSEKICCEPCPEQRATETNEGSKIKTRIKMAASTGTAGSDGRKTTNSMKDSDLRDKSIEHEHHKIRSKTVFSLRTNKSTTDPRRSSPSLPHLIIGRKNRFLAHFYSRHYENEIMKWQGAPSTLGSDAHMAPSSKRLNDYYAPRA